MNKKGQPLSPRKPPRRAPICLRHMEYELYNGICWSCRCERLWGLNGYCSKHKKSFKNTCKACNLGLPENSKKVCSKHDVIHMGKCWYCVIRGSKLERPRAIRVKKIYITPESELNYQSFVLSCVLKTLRKPMYLELQKAVKHNDVGQVNRITELNDSKVRLQSRIFHSRRGIGFMRLNDHELSLLVDGLERLRESLVLSNNPKQKRMLDVCCVILKSLFDFNSYSPLLKYNKPT